MRQPTQKEIEVAKALFESLQDQAKSDDKWDEQDAFTHASFIIDAKAAIRAMREPTPEMEAAAEPHMGGSSGFCAVASDAYNAMISAASPQEDEK